MSTTWARLAGATATFAMEVRLIDDDDVPLSVDSDEASSWGALRIWANGSNLTSHVESDEIVSSLHWYVLPICEWLVENWDAILHEERLPMPDVTDAVSGIERMVQQRLIGDDEENALDDAVRSWWHRHNLATGAIGSVLPSMMIRRWGDQIEFSMSRRRQAGVPAHVSFGGSVVERVPARDVSSALLEILEVLSHELVRRHPGSHRFSALRIAVDVLNDPARAARRLELLGAPLGIAADLAPGVAATASIDSAPAIALLFGTLAPQVRSEDVVALSAFVQELPDQPAKLNFTMAAAEDVQGLRPGPMGSAIGDEAWAELSGSASTPVDIESILARIGVAVRDVKLSDSNVRSVCVLTGDRAAMAINPGFAHGEAVAVRRFSLAHELCHLLIDGDRAVSLAIASGPWAPLDLEQRANAFAAAFLMPSELVGGVVLGSVSRVPADLARLVARTFVVPFTSAVDRLRNLGEFSPSEADFLRAVHG